MECEKCTNSIMVMSETGVNSVCGMDLETYSKCLDENGSEYKAIDIFKINGGLICGEVKPICTIKYFD